MYKEIITKELTKLDSGVYKVIDNTEDYYTETALKNLIKDYSKRLATLEEEVFVLSNPDLKARTINEMAKPYLGTELLEKYEEDPTTLTEVETKKYNDVMNHCKGFIEMSESKAKKQIPEIKFSLDWWKEGLKTGKSYRITETELDLDLSPPKEPLDLDKK